MITVGYADGKYFEADKAKAACWLSKAYKTNPKIRISLYHLFKLYRASIVELGSKRERLRHSIL